jgi:CspA family cold shock protein
METVGMPKERTAGMVVRLMLDKGFGFIKGEDGKEYFFHRSSTGNNWEQMQESTPVTFSPTEGPKGLRAEDVRLV